MMEDKGGTMTTAITNPKKITLEDLEEKLESFIHVTQKGHLQLLDIRNLDHRGFIRQPEIYLINSGEN